MYIDPMSYLVLELMSHLIWFCQIDFVSGLFDYLHEVKFWQDIIHAGMVSLWAINPWYFHDNTQMPWLL